jgi:hypothetical protein
MRTRARHGGAVVVHSLEHARAAVAAAASLGVPVTLVSAPGAAAYVGAPWFREVVAAARAEHPEAAVDCILDCGARAGDVMAALRAGIPAVRFTGRKDVAAKLAAIAEGSGARLVTRRPRALDLLDEADPEAACRAWLARR